MKKQNFVFKENEPLKLSRDEVVETLEAMKKTLALMESVPEEEWGKENWKNQDIANYDTKRTLKFLIEDTERFLEFADRTGDSMADAMRKFEAMNLY